MIEKMITIEIIEDRDKIKEYYAPWDRMYDAGTYEASLSLEWTRALLNTHVGEDRFFLMVLRDSQEIVGIVPLCIRVVKKHGISLSTLFPLAEYFNTHSDLLLKNTSEELIEVFIKALFDLTYRWDIFRINRFIKASPVLNRIRYNLENNFTCNYDIRRADPSFFIQLGDSYNDYLENKNSHFRNNLKRVSRKMNSLGDVTFLTTQDFHDFAEAYKIILSIEEKSWKHHHGTAISSSEKQREFYRELCKAAFDKGRLRLCVLNLNREPVAFEMGLVKNKRYYSVHGSYDNKFKKENPGTMLLARVLEDLIHDGLKEHDFFGEPFEWEKYWTDTYRWHKSLLIYNNTLKAGLFRFFNSLKDKLKQNTRDQLVLRDPRDIMPQQN